MHFPECRKANLFTDAHLDTQPERDVHAQRFIRFTAIKTDVLPLRPQGLQFMSTRSRLKRKTPNAGVKIRCYPIPSTASKILEKIKFGHQGKISDRTFKLEITARKKIRFFGISFHRSTGHSQFHRPAVINVISCYYTIGQLCHPEMHIRVKIAKVISIPYKPVKFNCPGFPSRFKKIGSH